MIADERHIPLIGYGAMLMESFVAVMALIAACVAAAGRLLRDELTAGADRHHGRIRGGGDRDLGLRHHAGRAGFDGAADRRAYGPLAHRRRADTGRWGWRRS